MCPCPWTVCATHPQHTESWEQPPVVMRHFEPARCKAQAPHWPARSSADHLKDNPVALLLLLPSRAEGQGPATTVTDCLISLRKSGPARGDNQEPDKKTSSDTDKGQTDLDSVRSCASLHARFPPAGGDLGLEIRCILEPPK